MQTLPKRSGAATTSCDGKRWQTPMIQHGAARRIGVIREIAESFDGVLLDQFGVLHDGRTPYPRAIEAVARLHAAGKRVVIVSNSSRRSAGTVGKLVKMGFEAEWFTGEGAGLGVW
jgi:FMN phosphatase YigB (HAD superfamily)